MTKTVRKQLSEAAKGRALGLLEAGKGVEDLANRFGVSRSTISRLKSRKSRDPVNEVPQCKKGTGPKKKYTMREVVAIEKVMLKNAHLTSIDLKRLMP